MDVLANLTKEPQNSTRHVASHAQMHIRSRRVATP